MKKVFLSLIAIFQTNVPADQNPNLFESSSFLLLDALDMGIVEQQQAKKNDQLFFIFNQINSFSFSSKNSIWEKNYFLTLRKNIQLFQNKQPLSFSFEEHFNFKKDLSKALNDFPYQRHLTPVAHPHIIPEYIHLKNVIKNYLEE